jgi:hypothetical protein
MLVDEPMYLMEPKPDMKWAAVHGISLPRRQFSADSTVCAKGSR